MRSEGGPWEGGVVVVLWVASGGGLGVGGKRADLAETPGFAVGLVDEVDVVFVVALFDVFGGGFGNGLLLELPTRRLEGAGLGDLGLPGPRLGLRVARDECSDFCQVWTVDVRFIDHV